MDKNTENKTYQNNVNYLKNLNNFEKEYVHDYCKTLVTKIHKILYIYEECEIKNDFSNYHQYLKNTIVTLLGSHSILKNGTFIELVSILEGLKDLDGEKMNRILNNFSNRYDNQKEITTEKLEHKDVRSMVFLCMKQIIPRLIKKTEK